MSHSQIALESLREINRELLVVGCSDVPKDVEEHCEAARGHVLRAIWELDPRTTHDTRPIEEKPVAEWKAALAASASAADLLSPAEETLRQNDITRN